MTEEKNSSNEDVPNNIVVYKFEYKGICFEGAKMNKLLSIDIP